MFQFTRFASASYEFRYRYWIFNPMGYPIQKSSGQSFIGSSPRLMAALHLFHRLLIPRYPPDTLFNYIPTYENPKSFKTQIFCCVIFQTSAKADISKRLQLSMLTGSKHEQTTFVLSTQALLGLNEPATVNFNDHFERRKKRREVVDLSAVFPRTWALLYVIPGLLQAKYSQNRNFYAKTISDRFALKQPHGAFAPPQKPFAAPTTGKNLFSLFMH